MPWFKIVGMPKPAAIDTVRSEVARLAGVSKSAHELMTRMVALLHEQMLKYNWVGFYMLDEAAQPPVLVLGPFQGAMTPHTRIPLNQGIYRQDRPRRRRRQGSPLPCLLA
jgi:putative methionine-R-sulfoxide reductase with GAF domain